MDIRNNDNIKNCYMDENVSEKSFCHSVAQHADNSVKKWREIWKRPLVDNSLLIPNVVSS